MPASSGPLAHWDDVETFRRTKGELDATWQPLGDAAGTRTVGVNRVRVEPGKLPTPPHAHGASEEVFFVLRGSGLAWQDGEVHEVRPRDCVIHRARGRPHTFVAGPEGLEYLVFGTRHPTEIAWLPRSGAIRIGRPWTMGRDDDPWDVEATVEPLAYGAPAPRPANILNVDEVEHEPWGDKIVSAPLATEERSELAGFHWEQILPGKSGSYPHCHSEEEEVFVILEGSATLELWRSSARKALDGHREEHALRPGHLVARPPGSRVAHAFRAGPAGVTMLVYGTRKPNDIAWFPRSRKILFRGLGVVGRIETLDYDDGELEGS